MKKYYKFLYRYRSMRGLHIKIHIRYCYYSMTEKFWTVEKKEDFKKLDAARTARREYMRKYMKKNRKLGNIKHWRQYLKEKKL